MVTNRALCFKIILVPAIIYTSAVAVSSLGFLSAISTFLSALLLGAWRFNLPARRATSIAVTAGIFAGAWFASSWWLAVGVYSMNQSYWWTGYLAAFAAAVWGGIPYAVILLPSPVYHPVLRSAYTAALLSIVVHSWPHPFNCTPAIGLLSALPLIQIVEVGGMPLLFFLLYFISFLITDLFIHRRENAVRRVLLPTVFTVVALWYGFGIYRLHRMPTDVYKGTSIQFGVIQPNIPIEGVPPLGLSGSREQLFTTTLNLLNIPNLPRGDAHIAAIVWPEIPIYFSPINNPIDMGAVTELVDKIGVPLLVNADMYTNETVHGRVPFYNTEQLFRPNIGQPEEYRKNRLIPIGEYLPLESLISTPETERILAGLRRYIPGDKITTFTVQAEKGESVVIGTPICLELFHADLVHQMVQAGAEAIISPANDAYFRSEAAARLGLAIAAIRAVENRVPVLRVTNSGLSGWVEPNGRIASEETLPNFVPASGIFRLPLSTSSVGKVSKESWGLYCLTMLLALLVGGRALTSGSLKLKKREQR